MSRPRILQVVEPLAARLTAAERIAHLDEDVRDAAAKAKRRLEDAASKYTVTGWTADDDAEYAIVQRNLIARLRLTRNN